MLKVCLHHQIGYIVFYFTKLYGLAADFAVSLGAEK